uniref:Uncharacterized protein n=1 Tax=Cannabis sativa TaxID=3483 RepID=A0A803P4Q2_CANSA
MGCPKTAMIGFESTFPLPSAFYDVCNDGSRLLGGDTSSQLPTYPTVVCPLGEQIKPFASCGRYIKSAMERIFSTEGTGGSSARKKPRLEVSAPGMGVHPQCHDPELRLGQPRSSYPLTLPKIPPVGADVLMLAHFAKQQMALLAERAAKEAVVLVTELEKAKAANNDMRATNETLWSELTNARF